MFGPKSLPRTPIRGRSRRRRLGFHPRAAARTGAGQALMTRDHRRDRRQVHAVARPDNITRNVRREHMPTPRTTRRAMRDHLIGAFRKHPETTLVTGLGAPRLRGHTLFLAIRRGWFRGCPRRLRRPLEPQHKLNQLFLAQPFKIVAIHPKCESRIAAPRKGGWVITNQL